MSEEILPSLLFWAPVCCLGVEREPSVHPFYLGLAVRTREELLRMHSQEQGGNGSVSTPVLREVLSPRQEEEEINLRDILQLLLAPARCGMFLSRSRLGEIAKRLGVRLLFSSRYDVAESLFTAAGQSGQVGALMDLLGEEAMAWERAYQTWAADYPVWAGPSTQWTRRTRAARRTLDELRAIWIARAAVLGATFRVPAGGGVGAIQSQPLELEEHND